MTNDILVRGGYVLTMDHEIGDLPVGDVLLSGDRIVEVAPSIHAPDAEIVDAAGMIVLPGIIDGHRHVWQSLLRGLASDWTFPAYMIEARAMYAGCFDAEDAYVANLIGGLESIQGGVTTVVDHSHLQASPEISDALARGLKDSGVGGIFCYGLQNAPSYIDGAPIDADAVKDLLTRSPDPWHDENAARIRDTHFMTGPLSFGVALPEATPYMPAEFAAAILARATALSPRLVTGHWNAISRPDVYVSTLSDLVGRNAFSIPTLLSHNNNLNEADLKVMASVGLGLCTCPDIECGMGIGPLMARRFVELGGAASLGLDLSAFVQADMFKQARVLLQIERKLLAEETGHMSAEIGYPTRAVLELLTLTGARSLGMDDEIGSLTPGKRADLIVVAPAPLVNAASSDPVAALIFHTDASDVDTVIVAGHVRKRAAGLQGVDHDDLAQRSRRSVAAIRERYSRLPRETLTGVWADMF